MKQETVFNHTDKLTEVKDNLRTNYFELSTKLANDTYQYSSDQTKDMIILARLADSIAAIEQTIGNMQKLRSLL